MTQDEMTEVIKTEMTTIEYHQLKFEVKYFYDAGWWEARCEYKGIMYHEFDAIPEIALQQLIFLLKNES